mmetsp:Transcript_42234/g.91806  ORF Transcript_42234/g.91806 Transcript_42234/m.91806 type:complete len:180 (-) Transcript_42234:10-549(-)
MFVIREILEVATSVPDAIAMLHNFPHCVSNNFDFADAKGRLASAEVGPGGRVSAMQTTGPYIVHTNEFLWDQWAIARQASVDPTSVARQTALRAFLNSTAAAGGFHSSLDSIQNRYAKPPIFQGSVGPPMQPTPITSLPPTFNTLITSPRQHFNVVCVVSCEFSMSFSLEAWSYLPVSD